MAQFIHPAGVIVKMIFWRLAPGFWLPAFSGCQTNRFGPLSACDEPFGRELRVERLSRVGAINQRFYKFSWIFSNSPQR